MKLKIKVGFIGFGRMGSALAQGAMASKVLSAGQITAFDVDMKARETIKRLNVRAAKAAARVVEQSDLIFLCVKPQQMMDLLKTLAPKLPKGKAGKICFVSVAAGVTLQALEAQLGQDVPVVRVMPNTPSLLRAGMSAMSLGRSATRVHGGWVETVLRSVGEVLDVPESSMDAVTAVSGSGPAYVFYLAEAMMEAGVELGLSPEVAGSLVRQTMFGAALMLRESGKPAGDLRLQVTSPGGTTEAAVNEFESKGLKSTISSAMEKAAERSRELSQGT